MTLIDLDTKSIEVFPRGSRTLFYFASQLARVSSTVTACCLNDACSPAHVALDAGLLEEFVAGIPTWWSDVMRSDPGWIELFMRNPNFRVWEETYTQRPQGMKRKLSEL